MRLPRIIGLIAAVIAALVLVAGAAVWLGAQSAMARRAAGDYLGGITGLPVTLGRLSVGFYPSPSLTLGELTIAQPAGFGGAALVELETAELELPWRSLWRGDPVLHAAEIRGVTLRAAIDKDGADNWSAVIARLVEFAGEGPSAWAVARLELERGTVLFHDARSDTRWRLSGIGLSASDAAPATWFPADLRLAGEYGQQVVHFGVAGEVRLDVDGGRYAGRQLRLRGWAGGEPMPVAGIDMTGTVGHCLYDEASGLVMLERGNLTAGGVTADFTLAVARSAEGPVQGFAVKTASFAPRVPARVLGRPLPATRDPTALGSLQVEAAGRLEPGRIVVDEFSGQLDETGFGGSLEWPTDGGTPIVRLQADRVDLDRYLAPENEEAAASPQATIEATVGQFSALDLDAEIRIAEAQAAGAKIRGLRIVIEPDGAGH
jgi:hypothetical protein